MEPECSRPAKHLPRPRAQERDRREAVIKLMEDPAGQGQLWLGLKVGGSLCAADAQR